MRGTPDCDDYMTSIRNPVRGCLVGLGVLGGSGGWKCGRKALMSEDAASDVDGTVRFRAGLRRDSGDRMRNMTLRCVKPGLMLYFYS